MRMMNQDELAIEAIDKENEKEQTELKIALAKQVIPEFRNTPFVKSCRFSFQHNRIELRACWMRLTGSVHGQKVSWVNRVTIEMCPKCGRVCFSEGSMHQFLGYGNPNIQHPPQFDPI